MLAANWWFQLWLRTIGRELLGPIRERGTTFQFLLIVAVLLVGFLLYGPEAAMSDLLAHFGLASILAIAFAIPLYVAWCAIKAAINLPFQAHKLGQWSGNTFVFHVPPIEFLGRITDSGISFHDFHIDGVPHGCGIETEIEVQGFENTLRAMAIQKDAFAQFSPDLIPQMLHNTRQSNSIRGLALMPRDKAFCLIVDKRNTNPSIVRVKLLSWTIQ